MGFSAFIIEVSSIPLKPEGDRLSRAKLQDSEINPLVSISTSIGTPLIHDSKLVTGSGGNDGKTCGGCVGKLESLDLLLSHQLILELWRFFCFSFLVLDL